ncbi:protein kinase domain-containing protein [Dokdonella soli]
MIEVAPEPRHTPADAATVTGMLTTAELRSGDIVAGRFRIDSMIGIGGMGVVYRATDLSLGIEVAIKLLRPELARKPEAFERFRQELLLARQVSSPHVVRIHDIAQHGERWLISMDYVAGESLEHRLDRERKLPTEDALRIVRHLLGGLAAAHQRNVVHRDLKPANILLDAAGDAYISDFGVARSLGATGLTQTGLVIGTPEYLSPEQARGETVDARSDLYTAGLILYEMLSGQLPFAGGTPAETVMQRLVRPPPPLAQARPDLPAWLGAFCDRLLRIRPAQRFASADEALRALDARKVPRPPLPRRIWLAAALALVAAIGAGDWLSHHPLHWPAPPPATIPATPAVAVLPFETDASLAPLGRAFEAHLRTWLRGAAALAVVERQRTLDALARTTPDAHGEALQRQLPEVARAANVARLVRAELDADNGHYRIRFTLYPATGATGTQRFAAGADSPATLPAAYREAAGALVAAVAGTPPPAPAFFADDKEVAAFGNALLAADRKQPQAAAELLAPLAKPSSAPALAWLALLRAEQEGGQTLPAQATRTEALARFARDDALDARALRIEALAGNGDSAAALTQLQQLADRYPHDPELALRLAETLADAGDGARAIEALDRRLAADPQDARALFLRGKYAIRQGDAQRAVDDYLVRALVLDTRAGDAAAEADAHNALGVGYERLGQLEAASEQYARAVSMRDKLGDRAGFARSLRNLAIVQAVQGDKTGAEHSLDRAKSVLEALGDRGSLADLHNDRGVVEEERGDFAAALAAYRDALALRQQIGDPAPIAESLNNIGFCYYHMGEFDNALVYWQQGLAQYRKLDDQTGALHIQQSIGLLEIARGHFDEARKQLAISLRTAEDHQLPEEEAVAQTYLGELDLAVGRPSDALAAATRAGQIFARRSDRRGAIEAHLLTARIEGALGAAEPARAALAAIGADAGTEQRAALALAQARLAALDGDIKLADSRFADALKLAGEAHAGMLALEARIAQARLELVENDGVRASVLVTALHIETSKLGHVPLRLSAIELELAQSLRTRRWADAAGHYREALTLLQHTGGWRDAALLHALGAEAFARVGDASQAAAARDAAAAARAALLVATPADRRTGLEHRLDTSYRQDSGQ